MVSNIVLIGFMGAGKDAVGAVLASKTGRRLLSTDEFIRTSEHKTIAEIFRVDGEGYFRRKERSALGAIQGLSNLVVATGGGMVTCEKNRRRLKKMGAVVHLDADVSILFKRVRRNAQRPLARSQSHFKKLYRQRCGVYDFCDHRINTTNKTPAEIADMIIDEFNLKTERKHMYVKKHVIATDSTQYPVFIGSSILGQALKTIPSCRKALIVSNPLVSSLYRSPVIGTLKKKNIETHEFILPDGEAFKNFNRVRYIYDYLLGCTFDRSDMVVALGGGVISDIAGFVASTYKRGTKFVVMPTTLLGQVDAAIGGKTGIDLRIKNSIGTFYQPDLGVIDIDCIQTLSQKDFLNGIAEVIKYGAVKDSALFSLLEKKIHLIKERDPEILTTIVRRCVDIKGKVVGQDEREQKGYRVILNFGHTVGHAIECLSHYRVGHGAAVAIGMIAEARIACKLGLLTKREQLRLNTLVSDYGLPTEIPTHIRMSAIRECIQQDKKKKNSLIRLPLLAAIGKARIEEVKWERLL